MRLVVSGEPVPGQLHSSLAQIEALFTFDQLVGKVLLHVPEHLPAANRYVCVLLVYLRVALFFSSVGLIVLRQRVYDSVSLQHSSNFTGPQVPGGLPGCGGRPGQGCGGEW